MRRNAQLLVLDLLNLIYYNNMNKHILEIFYRGPAMIYTDIFEAIRAFSPQDIVLNIKDRADTGRLVRRLSFDALGTGKGDFVILPRTGMNILFYRGQTDASWPAIPDRKSVV